MKESIHITLQATRLAVYPAANYLFFLVLSWVWTQRDYNLYVRYFSAANLLVVVAGIGLGGAWIDFLRQDERAGRDKILMVVLLCASLFVAGLLALGMDPVIGLMGLAFSIYALTEYALKGGQLLPQLILLRYGAAVSVLLLTALVFFGLEDAWWLAVLRSLAIVILLCLFFAAQRTILPRFPRKGKVGLGALAGRSSLYSLTALGTVGIQGVDKLLLASSADEQTLFAYSALFFSSILIGNRFTDLLLSQSLSNRHPTIRSYAPLFVVEFLGLVVLLGGLRLFYPDRLYGMLEILLFSTTAVALTLSDFLWWNLSVARSASSRYARVSVAIFVLYLLLFLVVRPDSVVSGILILLACYSLSLLAYFLDRGET